MARDLDAEARFDFYCEKLFPHAEQFYRISLCVSLNQATASKVLLAFYSDLAKNLVDLEKRHYSLSPEQFLVELTRTFWHSSERFASSPRDEKLPLSPILGSLTDKERLILALLDFYGYTTQQVTEILAIDRDLVKQALSQARAKICNPDLRSKLDAQKSLYFFSRIGAFLSDTLPQAEQKDFAAIYNEPGISELTESFRTATGTLQVIVSEFAINEALQHDIRSLFKDDQTLFQEESSQIDVLEGKVRKSNVMRWIAIGTAVALIIVGVAFHFKAPEPVKFDLLETLSYEATAMSRDLKNSRIVLPSSENGEIFEYLASDASLGLGGTLLKSPSWKPDGASIIDYSSKKVGVVQYSQTEGNGRLFLFYLMEGMNKLPKAESGKIGNLAYQAYGNNQINIVVWQEKSNTLGVLIGNLSVKEMATLVNASKR